MALLRFDPQSRISAEEALRHEYFSDVRNMSAEIERYSTQVTKILDFSLAPIKQDAKSSCNPGIEHYRGLIDELEKFAERSSNHSNPNHPPSLHPDQTIDIDSEFNKSNLNHEPFKEKSTKESDFVTIHKHQYLSSTHSLIHNHQEPKINREEEGKTKTVFEEGKMKKLKKKKTVSRAENFEKSHLADKSEKNLPKK